MAQLIPLPLTVSFFSKIQIGFTFLVPAHPGSPGKRAVNVCSSSSFDKNIIKLPYIFSELAEYLNACCVIINEYYYSAIESKNFKSTEQQKK